MDVLLYAVRGTALVNRALREKGAADKAASRQLLDALFCTITNANFDDDAILLRIAQVLATKNELIGTAKKHASSCRSFPKYRFTLLPRNTRLLRRMSACCRCTTRTFVRSNSW